MTLTADPKHPAVQAGVLATQIGYHMRAEWADDMRALIARGLSLMPAGEVAVTLAMHAVRITCKDTRRARRR